MHFIVKGNNARNLYVVEILAIKYETLDLWNDNSEEKGEKEIKMIKLWKTIQDNLYKLNKFL